MIFPSGPLPNVEKLEELQREGKISNTWGMPFTFWRSYKEPDNEIPDDVNRLFDKDGFYKGGV